MEGEVTPEAMKAPASLADIAAIAMIDDAFVRVATTRLPEQERIAVLALLTEMKDPDAAEDLASRGFDKARCVSSPDDALDALTDPDRALGHAFAVLSAASETLATMIEERLRVRQIVAAMRAVSGCEVLELNPDAEMPDLNAHQLVFIDYFLEGEKVDGSRAEEIAKQVEQSRKEESAQQIVLMSSLEKVRTFRMRFRKAAGIDGSAFCFVAKPDLDQPWKVRAHLEMFARAMPHSRSIGTYINAAKTNMSRAQDELASLLDDLDLGDFAYLQNQALRSDGHPLGDYLSWLLSSHLASLAFERDLRTQQAAVDALDFEETLVSATEPSTVVATFYHSALFARNLGPLFSHPRARPGDPGADLPVVQLGDVFLDDAHSKAIVVLSADCDLAFSPSPERPPDKETPVLLVKGNPIAVRESSDKPGTTATHGMKYGSEVYQIEWDFGSYRTVPLGGLKQLLTEQGYQLSNRDRLRPLYGLKLQQEFGNHILRVGLPIMPPVHMPMRGEIFQWIDESTTSIGILEKDELFASWFKGQLRIRITPSIAGRLRTAVEELLAAMRRRLSDLKAEQDEVSKKAIRSLEPKVDSIAKTIEEDERWVALMGDHELSPSLKKVSGLHGLFFVRGEGWPAPSGPAIVLQISDPKQDGGAGKDATMTYTKGSAG
jgi:hypothetical protein